MRFGCANLVTSPETGLILGVACSKGRGVILPGGKFEPDGKDLSYEGCARRELFEETGLVANKCELIFASMNTDGYYVRVFRTTCKDYKSTRKSDEGTPVWTTWSGLFNSDFSLYYHLLHYSIENQLKPGQLQLDYNPSDAAFARAVSSLNFQSSPVVKNHVTG